LHFFLSGKGEKGKEREKGEKREEGDDFETQFESVSILVECMEPHAEADARGVVSPAVRKKRRRRTRMTTTVTKRRRKRTPGAVLRGIARRLQISHVLWIKSHAFVASPSFSMHLLV